MLHAFFYKNILYKNIEAEIWLKNKNVLSISPASRGASVQNIQVILYKWTLEFLEFLFFSVRFYIWIYYKKTVRYMQSTF